MHLSDLVLLACVKQKDIPISMFVGDNKAIILGSSWPTEEKILKLMFIDTVYLLWWWLWLIKIIMEMETAEYIKIKNKLVYRSS